MEFFCNLILSNSLCELICVFVHVFVCVSLAHCVDSKTSAVRVYGDTWLRWRGPRVEYCRCALRGRELCHIVPVMSEWDAQTHLDSLTRVTSTWLILTRKYALDLQFVSRSAKSAKSPGGFDFPPHLIVFLPPRLTHLSKAPVIPARTNEEYGVFLRLCAGVV